MTERALGKCKRRCPRCRGTELSVTEVTAAVMGYRVSDGVLTRVPLTDHFGSILSVWLKCDPCEYSWRPRGATDVYSLLAS